MTTNKQEKIQFFDFEFLEKKKELNEIYTFKFKPLSNFNYNAGQWIHIGFPTQQKDKERVRHMSFSTSPEENHIGFTMDTASRTLFKSLMLNLHKGDIMKGFKINGNLIIEPDFSQKIVFIAGGIGITPIRSLIKNIKDTSNSIDWKLLHISRDGFLFEDELSQFINKQWRVSRSGIDSVWKNVIDSKNTKYFLCGSNRFVSGLITRLLESGISENQIVVEDFH